MYNYSAKNVMILELELCPIFKTNFDYTLFIQCQILS